LLTKDELESKRVTDPLKKPGYVRNIIQKSIRVLSVSTNMDLKDNTLQFVESCFEILGKSRRINLVDVACCVQDYWQIQIKMNGMNELDQYLAEWLKLSQHTFAKETTLDVQWRVKDHLISFGGKS
jgi:hypothetical protein